MENNITHIDSKLLIKSISEIVNDRAIKTAIQPMLSKNKFTNFDEFVLYLNKELVLNDYNEIYYEITDLGMNHFQVDENVRFIRKNKLKYLFFICILEQELELENKILNHREWEYKFGLVVFIGLLISLFFII